MKEGSPVLPGLFKCVLIPGAVLGPGPLKELQMSTTGCCSADICQPWARRITGAQVLQDFQVTSPCSCSARVAVPWAGRVLAAESYQRLQGALTGSANTLTGVHIKKEQGPDRLPTPEKTKSCKIQKVLSAPVVH